MRFNSRKTNKRDETYRNHQHVAELAAKLLSYYTDPQRTQRKVQQECKYCFYVYTSRLGGAAISEKTCPECEVQEVTSGSTHLDYCCSNCSTEKKICKHCGATMD